MLVVLALIASASVGAARSVPLRADTLRLDVGAREVDLSKLKPHYARVTVERLIDGSWRQVSEWTNRLEVGDSAGRGVHRWTTIGTAKRANGETATWQLYQTFDKKTIAQLGFRRTSSDGGEVQVTIDGPRIRGTRKAGGSGVTTPIEVDLPRAAYPMAATDLVPSGVKLRPGLVMTFPAWQVGMTDVQQRIFTVIGRREIPIEGKQWKTWAVEERSVVDGTTSLIGTWYMADDPPYMVYAEVEGPNGTKQRMTEVLIGDGK